MKPIVDTTVFFSLGGDELKGQQYLQPDLAGSAKTDAVVSQAKSAHDGMRTTFEALEPALQAIDPTMTPEAQFLDIERRAQSGLDDNAKKVGSARVALENRTAAVENDIQSRMELSESDHAGEIRAHVLKMDDGERVTFVHKAIEAGDKETVGAILKAPAYLSGLEAKQHSALMDAYREKVAGDLVALKAVYLKATKINDMAFNQYVVAHGIIFPKEKVEEIEARASAAKASRDAVWKL
jgi:hypothetical protein